MPVNKSSYLRLSILEELLKNNMHSPEGCDIDEYLGCWTKEELAVAVSEKLDLDKIISKKSIENDLKKMEDFYNAPIDKKDIFLPNDIRTRNIKKIGYFWHDPETSIFNNNNLSPEEFKSLRSVIDILKQFKGLNHFEDVESLIDKLELKASKTKNPQIFFDTIDNYSGLEHVSLIATAIKEQKTLQIKYQPFNESHPEHYTIHPYQLREFNNRWFVLAHTEEFKDRELGNYGLSRILEEPKILNIPYKKPNQNKVSRYFKDIIGVTNYESNHVEDITFKVFGTRAAYVKTKPWHSSQEIVEENRDFTIFKIVVKENNELLAQILQFGEDIEVLTPGSLRDQISLILKEAVSKYE